MTLLPEIKLRRNFNDIIAKEYHWPVNARMEVLNDFEKAIERTKLEMKPKNLLDKPKLINRKANYEKTN